MAVANIVADTVIEQIKAMDFMALPAWGTSKIVKVPEGEKHMGGVIIHIENNPKIPENATVEIVLNWGDLYNIEIKSDKNMYLNVEDIYFDCLIEVIDEAVG